MLETIRTILAFVLVLSFTSPVAAQTGDDFIPLFDGTLAGWVVENSDGANFTVQDGVLRVEGPEGWLRSEGRYADFVLRSEIRFLTDDADTGYFVRVADTETEFVRGWPGNSYQIQARDMSANLTTNPIWSGNVYRHRVAGGETEFDADAALEAYRPTGEWQEFEIHVVGDSIVVWLNGTQITTAYDLVNPEGYIGIQGETGITEIRSLEIREQ